MKFLLSLCLFLYVSTVLAIEPPVPAEFIGLWVPEGGSCQAISGLRVEQESVTLFNGPDSQKYGDLDICHSCEGGARYSGEVVWLLPDFRKGIRNSFTVRFNANEEKGITVIDIDRDDLKKRFPLHNVKLHMCR